MKRIVEIIFPILIFIICVFLIYQNYVPGTYLLGWDSLHPEFNFQLAFQRFLSGVWREDQGLGVLAAHSHMSDLPRLILLWISSFILPVSVLRYFYIFVCLVLGPLGTYFFLKYVFDKEEVSFWIYPAAFLGALFYLLNLGTLQNFYVPFEMFTTAFAFLPWLFLFGLKYLREGRKNNLILFVATAILSSPMAYAATLWYANFVGIFTFLLFFTLISTSFRIKIKRFFVLLTVAFTLNLYWIFPNAYSIAKQSATISGSYINRLFSPEAFLRNQDYGTLENIVLQKNFLFNWRNYDFQNAEYKYLLNVWANHLSARSVTLIGYILAAFSVLGLAIVFLKKERVGLSLVPVMILTLFFLFNTNGPGGAIYSYLYNNFNLFREGFRMPFTKFSVLYDFLASFYFGYFLFQFLAGTKWRFFRKAIAGFKYLSIIFVFSGLIYFMLPAFKGELIGNNVKVDLPNEYFEAYKWLNTKEGRIGKLPMNSLFNWEFHNWGFEGSGWFTWFLSTNPQLDRDFDRWSKFNEDFYKEASFALYNDPGAFGLILEKYQVKYLLLDESIMVPGGEKSVLYNQEIKNLFSVSNHIKEVQKFGFLTIYETNFEVGDSFVSAPKTSFGEYLPNVIPAKTAEPQIKEDLTVNRGFKEAYNCDLEKVGSVNKSFVESGIRYRAEGGGVACDYLDYPDLEHGKTYVLRIAGENREGRSLKIYLYNYQTKRFELEELLPSGKFDESYLIYPKSLQTRGFTLNFETRSFGRIASENLVTEVEFYETSYKLPNFVTAMENNLMIKNIDKDGTWLYKIDVEGSGLLQLGQGYETDWAGIRINDGRPEVLKHSKINTWANGWEVPSGTSKIYVFFWPQLLEWGGVVLGTLTLIFALKKKTNF